MYYIETKSTDPYYNLAFEEYVFSGIGRENDCFMLWQNANTIVVGRFQNTVEEINIPYVREHDIKVARRLSGGGAVYHDLGNLNFTFVASAAEHRDFDFKVFAEPMIRVLRSLGIKAEFTGRNDIMIDGKKFSGNSQYMRGGRLLHHGTLMLSSDMETVSKALKVSEDKFISKSAKSVRSHVTSIAEHLDRPVGMAEFKRLILEKISETSKLEPVEFSENELAEIKKLRDDKYATWEWNFGNSPHYSENKKRRIEGVGSISLSMEISKGVIEKIAFSGDFFGNGDMSELTRKLCGSSLEPEALKRTLSGIDLEHYFAGIDQDDFMQLLLQ
ncbi:MAG: lipoate--protein ligase [Oscillospiraceae bacterium]